MQERPLYSNVGRGLHCHGGQEGPRVESAGIGAWDLIGRKDYYHQA